MAAAAAAHTQPAGGRAGAPRAACDGGGSRQRCILRRAQGPEEPERAHRHLRRPSKRAAATQDVRGHLYRAQLLFGSLLRQDRPQARAFFCEELHYNGQRRRDVPDLGSGTLYIDVGDRPLRRKRHSFHHELWHMVDYHLLGNQFEAYDEDWCVYNPTGFSYGRGGKHMRSDSKSSQLASAPSCEFLNRYSTSSVAEDKAEIWATLMCYQHVLVDQGGAAQVLVAKASLLQARARQICDELDDGWWARVREAQLKQQDHWEAHSSDEPGKKQYWFNWVTGERRDSKPEGHQ